MPQDSLRVVAVPRPRSGAALFAGAFSVGLHVAAIMVFWGRPFFDIGELRSRLGAVLGVDLLSSDEAPPARALAGAPRPRAAAALPPRVPKEIPGAATPVQVPGAETIALPARRPSATPGRADREMIAAPRTPAAAEAVGRMEAELASRSSAGVRAPKTRKLAGRIGPPPARVTDTPGRPALSLPPAPSPGAGTGGAGEADAKRTLPGRFPAGGLGAGGPAAVPAGELPPVEVTASTLEVKGLGRWTVFEMRARPGAQAVPADVLVVSADAAVARAAATCRERLPKGSTVAVLPDLGAKELERVRRMDPRRSRWLVIVAGPEPGGDLIAIQKWMKTIVTGLSSSIHPPVRVAVVGGPAEDAYARGWLARRTGGFHMLLPKAELAPAALEGAFGRIGTVVFDPVEPSPGVQRLLVPAKMPAVFRKGTSRLFVRAGAAEEKLLVVWSGHSGDGISSLPLAASGKLLAAKGELAKQIALGEIDRLLEFAARTGLSDETRRRVASLAAAHGITPPRLP